MLLRWLKEGSATDTRIERADRRLADELTGTSGLQVEPAREHFDYVYRNQDLTQLAGRKYHAKRNYINTFRKNYQFSYEDFTRDHIPACLDLAERWCQMRRCAEDMGLSAEWAAVREALVNRFRGQHGIFDLHSSPGCNGAPGTDAPVLSPPPAWPAGATIPLQGYTCSRGSRVSRRPSPMMLTASTMVMIARPGKVEIHHWVRR